MALRPSLTHYGDEARFGDVECRTHPDGRVEVLTAPPLTRISLAMVGRPWCVAEPNGINLGPDQVWYVPIDVDQARMELICRKVRDMRPLMAQSAEEVAAGDGRGV